jgi:hypothetical protein
MSAGVLDSMSKMELDHGDYRTAELFGTQSLARRGAPMIPSLHLR